MNWRIVSLPEVTSTSDLAKGAPPGTVIVAARQTAGRGRLGRIWHSPAGGLWFSVSLAPPVPSQSQIARALALALARHTGLPIRYRPPNDLELRGRKLGGVLVEAAYLGERPSGGAVGVGINVNNRALDLPPPVREGAISLRDATGRIWELGELLATVLQAIETEIKEGVCQSSR